jgi:hypothetical protein
VNQLKRLADVRVRHGTEPPAFAGAKGVDSASQHLDEEDFGHPREHRVLAGTLNRRLAHHPL